MREVDRDKVAGLSGSELARAVRRFGVALTPHDADAVVAYYVACEPGGDDQMAQGRLIDEVCLK